MTQELEKRIEELESLVWMGELKTAKKEAADLLSEKKITKEQELKIINLQSEILNYYGKAKESLVLTSKVLAANESLENTFIQADAYMQQAFSYYYIVNLKECLIVTEKALALLIADKKHDEKQIARRIARLLLTKAVITSEFGDLQKGKEYFQKSYEYAVSSGSAILVAQTRAYRGYTDMFFGNLSQANELVEESLKEAISIGSKSLLIDVYFVYGTIKHVIGKKNIAIESFLKGIELANEIGFRLLLHGLYLHLGNAYKSLFRLDEAFKYYELVLGEIKVGHYLVLSNISSIYLIQNNINEAQGTLQKALKDSKKIGEKRVRPYILHNLVLTSLLLKDQDLAKDYLLELEQLKSEEDFEHITQHYQTALVLILKESTRIQDWIQAIEILEQLLADEKLPKETQIDVLYHLVEIRLKELQVTADQEVLAEVKKYINQIQSYAEERQQFNLLANIYRLKSQLSLVELDAEHAVDLLITAKTLAKEKHLDLIAHKIAEEQAKLFEQQNMWSRLKEQKAPLKETLKQVHLDNSAKQLANETILAVRNEKTKEVIEYRKLFALKM